MLEEKLTLDNDLSKFLYELRVFCKEVMIMPKKRKKVVKRKKKGGRKKKR